MPENNPGAANSKMSERTLRKTLEEISKAQQEQRDVERERAGASKFRAKILTVFGGCITAAAIAAFVWVWNVQTTSALRGAAIEQVRIDARNHDAPPPGHGDLEAADVALQRRVDGVERATKAINERLTRNDELATTRHGEVLNQIRALRGRRTWGGR